jgi:hypothetical protein
MRKPRLRAAVAALSAVLATAGLTAATQAPAYTTGAPVQWVDAYNKECLYDTWAGPGTPTSNTADLISCDDIYTHPAQIWVALIYPGYVMLQLQYSDYCLDGREGKGNVTLQVCGVDGTHEHWIELKPEGSNQPIFEFENQYNGECLDGREGDGNVTVQSCSFNYDDRHELWFPAPA